MTKPNAMHYAAADAVIANLNRRKGLRHEWDQIDDEIREEIREDWAREIASMADVSLEVQRNRSGLRRLVESVRVCAAEESNPADHPKLKDAAFVARERRLMMHRLGELAGEMAEETIRTDGAVNRRIMMLAVVPHEALREARRHLP